MDTEAIEKIATDCFVGWGYDMSANIRWRMAEGVFETLEQLGYRKLPKDRHELRMEIHRITSLLARRTVGEASKKNLSGIVVTRFNDEADTEILSLIPDELPKEKPRLLSDEEIEQLWGNRNYEFLLSHIKDFCREIAQAQLDICKKHYEG